MRQTKTQELTLMAVLTALTLALGKIQMPTPTGFVTMLDVGIFFTAFYLGKRQAGIVGALSGFLIDLISGYPHWMIHSLIAHGAQGFFAGFTGKKRVLGLFLSSLAMVGWYFIGSLTLGYGLAGSLGSIPSNIGQNFYGMLVGYVLYRAFDKVVKR